MTGPLTAVATADSRHVTMTVQQQARIHKSCARKAHVLSSRQVILPGSHDKDDISLTQEAAKRAGSLEWVVIHHMLNWQFSQMAEGDQGGQQF